MYLKNELSKICGRQPIKNFTWSILEYLGIIYLVIWLISFQGMNFSEKEVSLLGYTHISAN